MRHKKQKATLGRVKEQRKALMRNLAESLVVHESITTTLAKAKALRIFVEPLITKAKKGDLTARRQLLQVLFTKGAVEKMIKKIGPKYKDRNGGYTRIIKLSPRKNDSAEMAKIELV